MKRTRGNNYEEHEKFKGRHDPLSLYQTRIWNVAITRVITCVQNIILSNENPSNVFFFCWCGLVSS